MHRLKVWRKKGKENVAHKPQIENDDLKYLKANNVFFPCKPDSLLKNVWFHVSLYWCRTGREEQWNLTTNSFLFEKDTEGREYGTMAHDDASKYHPAGLADVERFEKLARMYKSDSKTDGYTSLKSF